MKYAADTIAELARQSLKLAKERLSGVPVHCGREPRIPGLHGWVFEQTVQFCLLEELAVRGIIPEVEEQSKLCGKAKADLRVGHVLVEIKTRGLFGISDVERYRKYKQWAQAKGYRYLFLTASETYMPYRRGICDAVGEDSVFLLDQPDHWERFVETIVNELASRASGRPPGVDRTRGRSRRLSWE